MPLQIKQFFYTFLQTLWDNSTYKIHCMPNHNRIPVAVFQIDTDQFDDDDFDNIIENLVKMLNSDSQNLQKEKLSNKDFQPHKVLLYSIHKKYPPKWRGFIDSIVDSQSRLHLCQNVTYSYVCFIGISKYIFAVAGGYGSTAIARFTRPNFGLEILVRLFEKDSKVIKAIQDKGLTGSILGQTKFYRGDQRFSDENQFGKIFQEIKAELNKKILTKSFGFKEAELKRKVSGCLAKSSFEIKKAVDFDTLRALVSRFAHILENMSPKFTLNKVQLLNRRNRRHSQLIDELDEWMYDQLFSNYKKGVHSDVDVCHKNFEEYLTAAGYQIVAGKETIDIEDVFTLDDAIRELRRVGSFLDGSVEEFKYSLTLRQVYSLNNDGDVLTRGNLASHIHGEFTYKENSYFLIDGEWYRILPAFIKELNEECSLILKDVWSPNLLDEKFDLKKRESEFNLKFVNRKGHLVFDTITPHNIEACDIIQYDKDNVHLIHVKKGFNNSVRDLTSQINIAAKYIREDLRTGLKYLALLESEAKKGITSPKNDLQKIAKQPFPVGGIKSIFQNSYSPRVTFCLAFVDEATSERSLLTDTSKFKSNIAKFSLLELHREIGFLGFGFKVIQLNRI